MNELDSISIGRQCLHDQLGAFQWPSVLRNQGLGLKTSHQIHSLDPEQRVPIEKDQFEQGTLLVEVSYTPYRLID